MKKLTITLMSLAVCFLMTQVINAQAVNQGAWSIGGSIGFSSESVDDGNDDNISNFNFSPDVAYFIIDNLGIRLGVNYMRISRGDNSSDAFHLTSGVRYYVYDALFAQAGLNLDLTSDVEGQTGWSLGVGYSWFLNNSVAIEPAVNYSSFNETDDYFAWSSFGLNIGVRAFIGRE